MRTRKRKPHIALILSVSLVWLMLSAGGDVALSAWQPPIGIPVPSFGIEETYRMYDDESNRNPALHYTQNSEGGYYTHYVDNTHPNATDTNNPYGTANKPRKTIPMYLTPGSVVEVHNGIDILGSELVIQGFGTAQNPIFVRGVPGENPPYIYKQTRLGGTYLIFEDLTGVGSYVMAEYKGTRDSHHIAVRNNEFYSLDMGPGGISVKGSSDLAEGLRADDIVFYNNTSHDFGDLNTPDDQDYGGGGVGWLCSNVWFIDNVIYNTSGSGIQINASTSNPGQTAERIYIGRNHIYRARQAGIGIKYGLDLIISQNTIHDIIDTSWSISKGMGVHYGPQNVWFLFNEVYNGVNGFWGPSTNEPDINVYLIGNMFHDLTLIPGYVYRPDYAYDRAAITWYGTAHRYIIGNTIYNVPAGINGGGRGGEFIIVNNIIANVTHGKHVLIEEDVVADVSLLQNNLFNQPGGSVVVRWGSVVTGDMDILRTQTSTGQGCIVGNPQFTDSSSSDFHLQPTSPAIDAGTSSGVVQEVFDRFEQLYGIDIRKDIEGNPRTEPWNIGAYEYVPDPNNPTPVLQAIGDKTVDENVTLSFTVNATDPNGEAITYAVQSLPSGATLDSLTGDFAWTPSYTQAGSYQVRFIASDGNSSDSETITITVNNVNRAPILGAISDQTVNENALLSFSVDATDADGETITYSVTSLPTGAVFAGQTFTWTPSYDQAGNYPVTLTADDGQAQDSQPITITVINVNRAPVLTAIGNRTAYADVLLTFTIDATDPDGDAITYSAGTLPSGATFTNQDFNWTSSQSQTGSYDVTFIAGDGQLQDSETVTITVDVDSLAPTVTNLSPAAGSIQVPLNNLITLNIADTGIGVEAKSVKIKVRVNDNPNNYTVYFGDTGHYTSSEGDCRRLGTKADYRFVYQSTSEMFYYDQTVTVTVNATDLAGNVMDEYSYSFATEMHSFGQNKQVNSGLDNNDRPVTVCDSSGNIWSAWQAGPISNRDIYISKLTAGEENFNSTIQLTNNANDQCNPAVALDSNDKLYVVWQDNREGDWDIYVSTSVDGISWSTETRVNDPNDDNQVNPAIVIDGQNYAHVVWQDDLAVNQDIFIATSSDGFATPTVSQQITFDNFDQVEPAVAADSDNTIYVVWTDGRNGSSDIYGAASNNPWTNVAIVSNTNNQSSPAIAAESAGSILHLLWIDDTSGDNDIYYASSNGLPGSPLTGSSIIDDSSGADQLDPTIAVTGSTDNNLKVFACWQDWRNTDTDLYFAELSSGSGTNVFVDEGGSNAYQGEPTIGISEYNHPYIMWADNRSTNTDIYYAGSTFIEPVALASELVTASASSSTIVGTDPQAITTVDDVSVVVPAGACSYDVAITITKIANLPTFDAPCLGGYDFGPSGIQFSQPVTITIPYAFSGSDGLVTPWFSTFSRTPSQEGITDIHDIPISSSLHAISFKTTHFTAFYLLGGGGDAAIFGGGGGGGGCSVSASGEGNIVEFILPYIGLAVVMAILKMRDARYRKARNMTAGKC